MQVVYGLAFFSLWFLYMPSVANLVSKNCDELMSWLLSGAAETPSQVADCLLSSANTQEVERSSAHSLETEIVSLAMTWICTYTYTYHELHADILLCDTALISGPVIILPMRKSRGTFSVCVCVRELSFYTHTHMQSASLSLQLARWFYVDHDLSFSSQAWCPQYRQEASSPQDGGQG